MVTAAQVRELIGEYSPEGFAGLVKSACAPATFVEVDKVVRLTEVSDLDVRILGVVKDLPGEGAWEAPLLVADVELKKDLTERSSRVRQFKLARAALQYVETTPPVVVKGMISQGVFVFHDKQGNFRVSLVTVSVENGKFKWSQVKRQSFYVQADPDANATFIQRMCMSWASLKDIKEVFSVEKLTKEFYNQLYKWYERACDDKRVEYPNDIKTDKDNRDDRNRKHLLRLITRLMFVWFLKQKKLVPEELFDEAKLKTILKDFNPVGKKQHQYYRAILQNLFFATLNSEIEEREFADAPCAKKKGEKPTTKHHGVKTKYRYADEFAISKKAVIDLFHPIPFLNGGLFECLDQENDEGKVMYYDGFSQQEFHRDHKTLTWAHVPNDLFFDPDYGIIPLLKRYNFTVEENTPGDADVALDPELLGKVFENLLGAYNPETEEVVRKSTGSFYTPREIVNYMVDESLIAYLDGKTADGDVRKQNSIRALVKDGERPDDEVLCSKLSAAVVSAKVLDPACGSGAFPMGALLKMTEVLRVLNRMPEDANLYKLKLQLIENCIFGSDIQEIAVQISKLRFFISLVCEQKPNWDKPNYGINTLPNLETKFVAANSLIGLKRADAKFDTQDVYQGDLFFDDDSIQKLKDELWRVRHKHFLAQTRKEKNELRKQDKVLRTKLAARGKELGFAEESTQLMAEWDPYDQNHSSMFFEPAWMFNEDEFDLVISNPPYVRVQALRHEDIDLYKKLYDTAWRRIDVSTLFIERFSKVLGESGILCFISSNQFMYAEYGRLMRKYLAENKLLKNVVDFADLPVFESAITYVSIFQVSRVAKSSFGYARVERLPFVEPSKFNTCEYADFGGEPWSFTFSKERILLKKLQGAPLLTEIAFAKGGIITGSDDCFIFKPEDLPVEREVSLPLLRTEDIRRYYVGEPSYRIFYPCQLSSDGETCVMNLSTIKKKFPKAYKHVSCNSEILKSRKDSRNVMGDKEHWYQPVRFGTIPLFKGQKILSPGIVCRHKFVLDEKGCAFSFGNMYSIVSRSAKFKLRVILGILNSRLIEFFMHRIAPVKQGGYFAYGSTVLERVPLIYPKDETESILERLVDQILASKQKCREADTSALEAKIDALVYKLYGLTEEEIAVVEQASGSGEKKTKVKGEGEGAKAEKVAEVKPVKTAAKAKRAKKPQFAEEF